MLYEDEGGILSLFKSHYSLNKSHTCDLDKIGKQTWQNH